MASYVTSTALVVGNIWLGTHLMQQINNYKQPFEKNVATTINYLTYFFIGNQTFIFCDSQIIDNLGKIYLLVT